MARKKKEPDAPLTETQVRAKRAIVDDKVTNEVIRDAFLEGRDELAASMLRQRDGQHHAKAGAAAIKRAETGMREMPPTCYGAIPRLRQVAEDLGVAHSYLNQLPHEMRAPNSRLFGRMNQANNRLTRVIEAMKSNCNGGSYPGQAFANLQSDPRDEIPRDDVPLEGSKKRRQRR